jgi:N-acetylglucosamine malate deacetylase 2
MNSTLAALVVIAHPDDETLFAGFIHALTQKLNIIVDLICVTNGEGGFRHSAPSEYLYNNLKLSNEDIGRQHLPRIRKHELLASGKILGIRKFFFYDQLDLKYDRNVDIVFAEQWNKEGVIQLLEQTIKTGNNTQGYDIMLIMLPNIESHGHHTASGLLALEAIKRLRESHSTNLKIPTVIGGSEFILNELPTYSLNRLAEISTILPNEFRFNRTWKLSNTTNVPDYRMIVIWACSEHKSQGGLIAETLTTYARENEQYFYFSINNELNDHQIRIQLIQNLFDQLASVHQTNKGNVL